MIKKYLTLVFFIQLFSVNLTYAQLPKGDFFQGYKKDLQGFPFIYHSPVPGVNGSLIVRANKDFRPIVWETERLPENYRGKAASFIWAYGMDTDVKRYGFDLYVNDEKYFSFKNPADNDEKEWTVEGKDGASLTFNVTMVDKYKDQMGFAVLTLPGSILSPGKPVRIKVKGEETVDGRIWYMTFKAGIFQNVTIEQEKVVLQENDRQYHVARFDFTHLGEKSDCEIKVGKLKQKTTLNPGYNTVQFRLPKENTTYSYIAKIKIGRKRAEKKVFTMHPVKEWTVYLVQHTHTDIGYTRPQTEILPEHLRYIDYALDFCDMTDDYPDDAKFRWTCEASWAVREYLKSRPQEQIERLKQRVKEGRIEVTGMFFNFSDIIDEVGLTQQTKTIKAFKEEGIDVTTVMQNDVNGIGWCLAEYFEPIGIKYLTMGQHGHRARIPFKIPTAFWWDSPSGKRLLAYRSEHYMHGNTLGLISGDINGFKTNLSNYLTSLEDNGYPFPRTAFQFSGYITDNSPPSTIACNMVKEWNEKYVWPKLRLATDREFMEYVEKNHGDELSVHQVAWPDWWTDGAGSAMLETKATRTIQSEMIANTGLISMAKMMGADLPEDIQSDIATIQDALLFYDEHTYGADQSISEPLSENSLVQWNEKAAYAWDAVKRASLFREKAMGFVQPFIEKTDVPSLAIFNTLNWKRSGLITVFIDHEILPNNKAFQIIDYSGNIISAQAIKSRSDGTYWGLWVEDVPAMGYKLYRIEVSNRVRILKDNDKPESILENEFYKLEVDQQTGAISSLYDKALKRELIDKSSSNQMGQFIYETLANRHQMERFTFAKQDTVYKPLEGERDYLSEIEITGLEKGPIWTSLMLKGAMPGCADEKGVYLEIRLYNKEKRIELHFGVHKLTVTDPESIYVAFPFSLEGSKLGFEAQGGVVYPGENQLEGTASDWNGIQNFAFARNEDAQIVFGSNDVPLVQLGAINTGHYYYKHKPETSHIYSWVLNNYWTTNFKASQEGELKWSYYITSDKDNSNAFASKFAWGSRISLLPRVFPASESEVSVSSKSLINTSSPNLLLVSAKPALNGSGIILQYRETDGVKTSLAVMDVLKSNIFTKAVEVNILEEEVGEIASELSIAPFETKFILIKK
jgi:hypothetical protein